MNIKKHLDYVFTIFASSWGLTLSNDTGFESYRQWGGGAELRLLLFPNKPSIGKIHLGGDLAFYKDFQSNMWSFSLGLNLYYGLWNY
jgi:hypothetical protein